MHNWHRLKYFDKDENWGNPYILCEELLLKLDVLREEIGHPFIVTSGTQGKHRPNSLHYQGKAVDFVCPDYDGHAIDFILKAVQRGFSGIGWYPHWQYKGKACGGMHVDFGFWKTRHWLGVLDKGEQVYRPLDYLNLKKYEII